MSFAELKPADAANRGARLRIVLWKAGLKPEVLVRPEVTPMEQGAAAQPQGGAPPAGRFPDGRRARVRPPMAVRREAA